MKRDLNRCEDPRLGYQGSMLPCLKCSACLRARASSETAVASAVGFEENDLPSCEQPVRLYGRRTGSTRFVPCRKCVPCVRNRHTQLGGKAFAEALTADHVIAVTLTYGGGSSPRSQTLDYRDVQLMLKRLRRDGYKVRYLVAGEYGSKRARAHWHIILYFRGRCPEHPPVETEKQHWRYWVDFDANGQKVPIGFAFFQKPDYHGLLYLLKYAVKDEGTGKSTRSVMMSKKPPLGADYWPRLAERWVEMGKPFSFEYTLPGANYGNGNPVRFYQGGRSAVLMWSAYRAAFYARPENRFKVPPVMAKEDDAWFRRIVPEKMRSDLLNGIHVVPSRPDARSAQETCSVVLTAEGVEFYKLHTGDWVRSVRGPDGSAREKGFRLWRVRGIGELIAFRRGHPNGGVRKLSFGETPF